MAANRLSRNRRGRAERHRARRSGLRAEAIAAWWLRLKGYRVLERQHRLGVGEIDLVVRRGRTLVFVEVKLRAEAGAAAEAIRPQQRRRIERAARAYLGHHPSLSDLNLRFDALLLVPGRLPRHIENAWHSETR